MTVTFAPIHVEPLGDQESFVYDLTVDEHQNFFANGVLVHNSNYISMDSVVRRRFSDDELASMSDEDIARYIYEFHQKYLGKFIAKSFSDLQQYLNAPYQKMEMALEKIMSEMILTDKKKRYCYRKIYDDGVWYHEGDLGVTGLDSVKSSTPAFARKFLDEIYWLKLTTDDFYSIEKKLKEQYNEFIKYDFDVIAEPTAVNVGLEKIKEITSDKNIKGMTSQVKACLVHNLINHQKGYPILPIINNGIKIKKLPLIKKNTLSLYMDVIGYVGDFPKLWLTDDDIISQIDRHAIWQKYMNLVNDFLSFFDIEPEQEDSLF